MGTILGTSKNKKSNSYVRQTKSDQNLRIKTEQEKLKDVLKIFQGCWITSLTGINFKSNRINSRKRPDKTENSESESYDFENTNVQVITEKMPKKERSLFSSSETPENISFS